LIGWFLSYPEYLFVKLCEYFLCSSLQFVILVWLRNFDHLIHYLHNELSIVVFLLQLYSLVFIISPNILYYKFDAVVLIEGELVGKDEIIFLILHPVNFVDIISHSWSSPSRRCLRVIWSEIFEYGTYQKVSLFN